MGDCKVCLNNELQDAVSAILIEMNAFLKNHVQEPCIFLSVLHKCLKKSKLDIQFLMNYVDTFRFLRSCYLRLCLLLSTKDNPSCYEFVIE